MNSNRLDSLTTAYKSFQRKVDVTTQQKDMSPKEIAAVGRVLTQSNEKNLEELTYKHGDHVGRLIDAIDQKVMQKHKEEQEKILEKETSKLLPVSKVNKAPMRCTEAFSINPRRRYIILALDKTLVEDEYFTLVTRSGFSKARAEIAIYSGEMILNNEGDLCSLYRRPISLGFFAKYKEWVGKHQLALPNLNWIRDKLHIILE